MFPSHINVSLPLFSPFPSLLKIFFRNCVGHFYNYWNTYGNVYFEDLTALWLTPQWNFLWKCNGFESQLKFFIVGNRKHRPSSTVQTCASAVIGGWLGHTAPECPCAPHHHVWPLQLGLHTWSLNQTLATVPRRRDRDVQQRHAGQLAAEGHTTLCSLSKGTPY